jgi:hypothetical protein
LDKGFERVREHQTSLPRAPIFLLCITYPDGLIEILRIANAIGNAAAQSSAMTQNARGPKAP